MEVLVTAQNAEKQAAKVEMETAAHPAICAALHSKSS
jgi:hypothetical protein